MIKELLTEEIQTYIDEHLDDDVADLGLRSELRHHSLFKQILEQIKSKKKAKSKLPHWFAQKGIVFPPTLSMEQCSSEQTAIYKSKLVAGEKLVDLTGGFGIDTFYLSRQFESTEYVEQSSLLCELARHNFDQLNAKINVNNTSAEHFLQGKHIFDWIYLDPARRDKANHKVFRLEDCRPDIVSLQSLLLSSSQNVMIKLSPMLDIKLALSQLKGVAQVHVIAVKNEVKELLFVLKKGFEGLVEVCCVNMGQNTLQQFHFDFQQEESSNSEYAEARNYLYEPNAAIMKAGAFKYVGHAFGLMKLDHHTHLYTSDQLVMNFPGRVFRVIEELPLNKKLRSVFPQMKANIAVRNYPLTVQQIRKKTGIKEGGEHYIFAFTDISAKRFVLCEKLY